MKSSEEKKKTKKKEGVTKKKSTWLFFSLSLSFFSLLYTFYKKKKKKPEGKKDQIAPLQLFHMPYKSIRKLYIDDRKPSFIFSYLFKRKRG